MLGPQVLLACHGNGVEFVVTTRIVPTNPMPLPLRVGGNTSRARPRVTL